MTPEASAYHPGMRSRDHGFGVDTDNCSLGFGLGLEELGLGLSLGLEVCDRGLTLLVLAVCS